MGASSFRTWLSASVWLAALGMAPGALAQQTDFKPERFDEKWDRGGSLKHMPVGGGADISFGGDARWRASIIDAPRLGLYGEDTDAFLLQRLLVHADLAIENDVRVFVQLGAHDQIGRDAPQRTDEDRIDLQQGFLDLKASSGETQATLRLGRQELVLGPRFVTTRDSANVRQRHDMARLMVEHGAIRLDAFYGRPTEVRSGAFDDTADQDQLFYGVRLQREDGALTQELYAYDLDRAAANVAGVTAHDNRLSLGARLSGGAGRFDFDAEAVVQSGRFGAQDIDAFGLVLDVGAKVAAVRGRLGARLTYGSGDETGDRRQSTFLPPFATSSWFGQNGLASFSNMLEAAGTASLTLSDQVSANLKAGAVWRARTSDYLYTGSTLLPGTAGGDAWTGASLSASLTWRPTANVAITSYGSYVDISEGLRAKGAHNVAFALTSLSLRF